MLTLPFGPSNSYFLSTAIHGIRRRSAASASRERVKAFSFTRSCCRAASHSCSDTIGGAFIAICPFGCSLSLSLLVAIIFLLCFLNRPKLLALKNFLNLPMHTARIPPVDPAPATITAVLAMHPGHSSFPSQNHETLSQRHGR